MTENENRSFSNISILLSVVMIAELTCVTMILGRDQKISTFFFAFHHSIHYDEASGYTSSYGE